MINVAKAREALDLLNRGFGGSMVAAPTLSDFIDSLTQSAPETAWLVEYTLYSGCQPMWLAFAPCNKVDFVTDSLKATRFSRRQDADAVIEQLRALNLLPVMQENTAHFLKSTEHQWVGPAAQPEPELTDAELDDVFWKAIGNLPPDISPGEFKRAMGRAVIAADRAKRGVK